MKKYALLIALLVSFIASVHINIHAMQTSQKAQEVIYLDVIKACQTGNIKIMRALSEKIDCNYGDKFDYTPLHAAACAGSLDIVKYLVEKKHVKIDVFDKNDKTPLCYAVKNNYHDIITYLLDNKANTEFHYNGETVLCYATRTKNWDLVTLLVNHETSPTNVNTIDQNEYMPLHYAILDENYEIIEFLLKNGADTETLFNLSDDETYKKTPLNYAARKNNLQLLNLLIKHGADLYSQNTYELTSLELATLNGHIEIAKALLENEYDISHLNNQDNNQGTPLWDAITSSHYKNNIDRLEMIKLLLDNGANIETRYNGETPLCYATRTNMFDLVKELIERKADIEAKDNLGNTPLHLAVVNGHTVIVKYLLNHKDKDAPIEPIDNNSNAPLPLINSVNNTDNIPLPIVEPVDKIDNTDDISRRQVASLEATDNNGHTPLHKVVLQGDVPMIKFLLKKQAQLEEKEAKRILISAITSTHPQMHIQKKIEIIKLLLKYGTTPLYTKNKALYEAACLGHTEIVIFLFKRGAQFQEINNTSNDAIALLKDLYYFSRMNLADKIKTFIQIAKDHDTPVFEDTSFFALKRIILGINRNKYFYFYLTSLIRAIKYYINTRCHTPQAYITTEAIQQLTALYHFIKKENLPENIIKTAFQDLKHIKHEGSSKGLANFLDYLVKTIETSYKKDMPFKNKNGIYKILNYFLKTAYEEKKYKKDFEKKIDLLTQEDLFLQENCTPIKTETKKVKDIKLELIVAEMKETKDMRLELIIGNKKDKACYKKRIFIPHAYIADSKKLKK